MIDGRAARTYLASELEEDTERGEDDGDQDIDAVRRAVRHLVRVDPLILFSLSPLFDRSVTNRCAQPQTEKTMARGTKK